MQRVDPEHARMNRQIWRADEEAYLREHYSNGSTKAIAAHLRRPIHKVYAKAKKLGLAKTEEYIRDPANGCRIAKGQTVPGSQEYRFPKGHVPANKGQRRPGYAPGRMAETQFRKGQRPHTWVPVGTILKDADGYLRIKVRERIEGDAPGWNPDVWPAYHRYVWEQENGPIPPGQFVVFKDRDRTNVVIENLELITKAENARRNRMWNRYPREFAEAIHLSGQLKRRIRNMSGRNANGEKQV